MKVRAWLQHALVRGLAVAMMLVIAGGAIDWGHAGGDDPDCDMIATGAAGGTGHASSAPVNAPQAPEHCYLCHALRLLHAALAARGRSACVAVGSASLLLSSAEIACAADNIARIPRAPPTVLF